MPKQEPTIIGRFHEVVIDCVNPHRLAEFWRSVLGGDIDIAHETPNWVALLDAHGIRRLAFQRVPESKTVKNRVHMDIEVTDLAAVTDSALVLGATLQGDVIHEPPGMFQVLLDPEGNEFCLVAGYPR